MVLPFAAQIMYNRPIVSAEVNGMYQALYRKYRPQTFSDVVGQRSVTETLRAQITGGKLSHAYLFTGTRGTGKTSCAKILAKAVNCENPQDGNPCNHCAACRAIDSGSCMDVQEIDAASNNGVDSVRILRDDAIYTPGEVKMRVYIIDEVHMLSTAAFNALLKIIEEPPAHLLFILATTELQKVPATILSRCQRFAFKRLRPDEIASRLNFIAYQEHIEIEPEAINLLARLADGGMRDGVSLLDQCASAANGPVTLESVYASLGLAGEKRTAELMQAIAEQDTAKALTIFSALYSAGKDVSALLGEMCALCRDLLVLRTAPKSGLSMLSGIATEQQALALQSVFSPGELMRVLTETQKTRVSFGKNTDVRVAAELLLMQLCEPSLRLDAQALDARISRVEEQLASGVLVKSVPKASGGDAFDDDRPPFPDDADDPERGSAPPAQTQEQSSAAPQAETPAGFWPALSEKLRAALPAKISGFFAVNGPVHPVLQGDALIMATDTELVIDLVKKTPNTEALVREKASAILGRPVSVRFALKNRLSRLGYDPMDALVQFGQQHSDIFTIK